MPDAREMKIKVMMDTYGTDVKRVCYLFLRDGELARDAAQEVFIRAWRALDQLKDEKAEKPWVMTITANVCRGMLKNRYFRFVDRSVSIEDLPEAGKPDAPFDDTLVREVMKLEDKYRQPVVMYYFQGLSCEETARALKIPSATVRTRMKRARDMLKLRLKGWYYDE